MKSILQSIIAILGTMNNAQLKEVLQFCNNLVNGGTPDKALATPEHKNEGKKPEPTPEHTARIPEDKREFDKAEPFKTDADKSIRPLFAMKSIAFGGISKRAVKGGATKVKYEIKNGKRVKVTDESKVKNADNVRTYWAFKTTKERDVFYNSQVKFCKENNYEMAIEKC